MKYKAVIFDLDGTLVDSIEDLADSMNKILSEHGLPVHKVDSYYGFVGMGLKRLVFNALPESHRMDSVVEDFLFKMKNSYNNNITNKTKPYDGINELLGSLLKNGIKISVLSNKADELTKKVVFDIFSDYRFEYVLGPISDELRKPNPENALLIIRNLDILPSESIFVGDTSIDMITAKNAGMLAVGVSWGFRTKHELLESGADFIIDNPSELIEILV